MTTTNIEFKNKQTFETIKFLIEKEFGKIKEYNSMPGSILNHFSFIFKEQEIVCYFCRDNKIYKDSKPMFECSSLASDRPNDIKTEAFLKIAKHFNCTLWENDCNKDKFKIFTASEKTIIIIGYKAPFDLYRGPIKKGDVGKKNLDGNYKFILPDTSFYNMPPEIVESWEAVYDYKQ